MNHLDKLIEQTRLYLMFSLLLQNGLLLAWLYIAWHFNLSVFLVIPITAGLVTLTGLGLVFALAQKVTEPSRIIQQAILHLSPTEHGTRAPQLDNVKYGHELLVSLISQIYEFASVTTTRQSADAVQQASLKNDFIANNMPLPLLVLDAHENIVFANPAALSYLQKSDDELLTHSVYSLLDMSFPNENTFDAWLTKAKVDTVTASSSWERVRLGLPDQQSVQFDLAAYYNKDNSSGYETMLLLFDHTHQYSQDDQAVSFIALAVHELRTPLTLLRGYIETFQDEFAGKLDPELAGFMHRMAASAEQLAAFVNNILNVARVEDDQLTLELHEENWAEVVQGAVDNYTLRAQVRGITLACTVANNLPSAAIDRVSIYEVIGNLIDNAIKYSGTAKKITISSSLNQEGLIETTVQDGGVGIPTSVIPNLFTKFYRNHRNRAQIGGTGLGLYLCKALITAHGGHIWVRSEEGKGSTFGFTVLPYAKLAEELKASNNKDITRSAHGWIKNHSLYRR